AIVYGLRHRLSPGLLADAVAPGAALALVIGGVGAFLGSQRLGAPTALPWGIEQFDAVRHPAHLYQTLATLLVLAIVWRVRRASHRPGFCFLLFVALYAGTRLLLEPAFAMPVTTGGGFRLVQVSALAATVVALTGMAWLDKPYAVKH
ncbi:MAG: prolipoprotein diacylglyceryl transferase family protein, partial [Anaerolineae bacterium]